MKLSDEGPSSTDLSLAIVTDDLGSDRFRDAPRATFLERALAPWMFLATLLYLALLSLVLHPVHGHTTVGTNDGTSLWNASTGLGILGVLYVLEFASHLFARSLSWKQYLLYAIVPPLRLTARDSATGTRIWLPIWGWSTADRDLQRRLERAMNGPMIALSLLVLPLMLPEFLHGDVDESSPAKPLTGLGLVLHFGTAFVWFAFAVEFLVMIAVVDRKAKYCRDHWIDLVVIAIPFIAFLRAARLGRVGRLLRLQTIGKAARAYRMKGVLLRIYRGLIMLDVADRLVRGRPDQRLQRLEETLAAKEQEVLQLRSAIAQLRAEIPATTQPARRAA